MACNLANARLNAGVNAPFSRGSASAAAITLGKRRGSLRSAGRRGRSAAVAAARGGARTDAGYAVDGANDGEQRRLPGAQTEEYDAVLLDLGLPRVDGLTLLRRWREPALAMPVLVLTARGSWHEKVQGIDGGADDYVAKPFRMEEVLARLRALIRRASGQLARPSFAAAPSRSTREAPRSRIDGAPVKLTGHEFRVLVLPDAPARPGRLAGRADRAHLRAGLRPRLEHRRGVRRAPAPQARARPSSRRCAGWAIASERRS